MENEDLEKHLSPAERGIYKKTPSKAWRAFEEHLLFQARKKLERNPGTLFSLEGLLECEDEAREFTRRCLAPEPPASVEKPTDLWAERLRALEAKPPRNQTGPEAWELRAHRVRVLRLALRRELGRLGGCLCGVFSCIGSAIVNQFRPSRATITIKTVDGTSELPTFEKQKKRKDEDYKYIF